MKEAIQKAIEGGYRQTSFDLSYSPLLDPLFWQALGKAMGWEDFEGYDVEGDFSKIEGWRNHWHRFIDHLASGGDAESFFKELLK